MIRESTDQVMTRLHRNRADRRRLVGLGKPVPAGLSLEIEHDEALLASGRHYAEAANRDEIDNFGTPAPLTIKDFAWALGAVALLIGFATWAAA